MEDLLRTKNTEQPAAGETREEWPRAALMLNTGRQPGRRRPNSTRKSIFFLGIWPAVRPKAGRRAGDFEQKIQAVLVGLRRKGRTHGVLLTVTADEKIEQAEYASASWRRQEKSENARRHLVRSLRPRLDPRYAKRKSTVEKKTEWQIDHLDARKILSGKGQHWAAAAGIEKKNNETKISGGAVCTLARRTKNKEKNKPRLCTEHIIPRWETSTGKNNP
jgi:hypothetical protein